MIIVDNKLKEREKSGRYIKVGIIGAGEMARGMINQIENHTPGMKVSAVYSRTLPKAISAFKTAKIKNYKITDTAAQFRRYVQNGFTAVTQDIDAMCSDSGLDVIVETTGSIEFGARAILKAFENGNNVLSFNAELDATLGPLLARKAKEHGVKYSVAEGDQPSVAMNLYRIVEGMGFRPLVCGNIKGILDRYRTPETQKAFAESWGMNPVMATNFVDGTKIAFEQACIANATGMKVARRGMIGIKSDKHVDELTHSYDVQELERLGGIVDYIEGAQPGPGVFIYATAKDELSKKYLKYGKLGDGPLYSFYIPYHLLFFEIASSIARMVDFDDIVLAAKDQPSVEVIAVAKRDLRQGEMLDGIGGFCAYGLCENSEVAQRENLLPMGLSEGRKLRRAIKIDGAVSLDDVEIPAGDYLYNLYQEQLSLALV